MIVIHKFNCLLVIGKNCCLLYILPCNRNVKLVFMLFICPCLILIKYTNTLQGSDIVLLTVQFKIIVKSCHAARPLSNLLMVTSWSYHLQPLR